jgi:hypothetical protein
MPIDLRQFWTPIDSLCLGTRRCPRDRARTECPDMLCKAAVPRVCAGKAAGSTAIPTAPGNRSCARRLTGLELATKRLRAPSESSKAVIGRLLPDSAGRTAIPSIWHILRQRRHGGIVRTRAVSDRGQCTWRDKRTWRRKVKCTLPTASGTEIGLVEHAANG